MNKKESISALIIKMSIVAYSISIIFSQIIGFTLGRYLVIVLRVISLALVLLVFAKRGSIRKKANPYPLLMVATFIPYLWNNAQIAEARWYDVASYMLVFAYSILLSFVDLTKSEQRTFYVTFIIFGIITSIFSWMQVLSTDAYYKIIEHLFSPDQVNKNYRFFLNGNLFGLTSHYSRNAFYVVVAIMFSFFAIKGKKRIVLLTFLSATLLAIGKRGHLLFLVISAIISYFIIKKVKISTVVKFCIATLLIIASLYALSFKVPQIRHTIERAEESVNSDDITTGRSAMYESAKNLYKENSNIPIGWGQYASSTNYYHPALHNDYLQLYYEVGLIGEMLVIIPNGILLIYAVKEARKGNKVAQIVLLYDIFFLTYSLTGLPHYDQETQYIYYMLNSMLFIDSKRNKK